MGYRRSGDTLTINVTAPNAKNWWRNFLGEGGPITLLNLDGADRTGHAVANRDAKGDRLPSASTSSRRSKVVKQLMTL